MDHPVMEGAVLPRSRSFWDLLEWSSWASDQRLVFDGVKHMIDRNSEWDKVGLSVKHIIRLTHVSGALWTAIELWFEFLFGGNCCSGFSPSVPCLGGDW